MYRYYGNQPCRYRPKCLPNGGVRLVNPHYLALFRVVIMISNNSVKHGVTQSVKQAVDANAYSKQRHACSKAG